VWPSICATLAANNVSYMQYFIAFPDSGTRF
jgi:hypothetical protein